MKRKNKEINIFSMSALDLFASALGAFILLAVIFMPFFPNTGNSPKIAQSILEELEKAKAENSQLKDENKQLESQNSQMNADLEKEKERVSLFGIETSAKKVVLLVDMSGSMRSPVDYTSLLESSVLEAVKGIKEDKSFAMIGFQGVNTIHRWPVGKQYETSGTTANRLAASQLKTWMEDVGSTTPTIEAFEAAFKLNPEAIILFNDGAPNSSPSTVLSSVKTLNRNDTEIHAVAIGNFWEKSDFIQFLGKLTSQNGGDLVTVISP